jgi:hypothetical protein
VGEDGWNLTTTDAVIPEDVSASYITPNAPNHWGVRALLGRWLVPADAPPGQEPERVVVLGYQFWQRYYSGDPAVVGRTIQLVRKNYQIVGVMPPRFRWREADIYVPLKVRLDPNIYFGTSLKIRPGVSIAEANADLQPILQKFAAETPARYPDTFRVNLRSIIASMRGRWGREYSCCSAPWRRTARGLRQRRSCCRGASPARTRRARHRDCDPNRQLLAEAVRHAVAGATLGVVIVAGLALIVAGCDQLFVPNRSSDERAGAVVQQPGRPNAIVFGVVALRFRVLTSAAWRGPARRVIDSAGRRSSCLDRGQVADAALFLRVAAAKGFLPCRTRTWLRPARPMSCDPRRRTTRWWAFRVFDRIGRRRFAVVSAGISTTPRRRRTETMAPSRFSATRRSKSRSLA